MFKIIILLGLVTGSIQFDDPNDITSVELKIQTVSGISRSRIFANGRHQIPIQIIAKAKRGDEETVLNFSNGTWVHILNLRFAESDEKLNWKGSGWSFSDCANDYSEELVSTSLSGRRKRGSSMSSGNTGSNIIIFYLYTDEVGLKRIAVSLDTDSGKHFTTADNASGAEKMSITIEAIHPIVYSTEMLVVHAVPSTNMPDPRCQFWNVSYTNYYIGVRNGIKKGKFNVPHNHIINSNHNEDYTQYMLVTHDFNVKGSDTLGYSGTCYAMYVDYNDEIWKDHICITHMKFEIDLLFALFSRLNPNSLFTNFFRTDVKFEIFDTYGNRGKFSVDFSNDLKSILLKMTT